MMKYCKEHVPEGTEQEDMTWGKCSVCGSKGGVFIVKTPGTFKDEVLEPELEIVAIVQEMALEEESALIIDPVPLHTGSAHTPSQEFTETPVEAELDLDPEEIVARSKARHPELEVESEASDE